MITPVGSGNRAQPGDNSRSDKWPTSFADGSLRIQVPKEGTKELRVELIQTMSGNK